ncbi:MAG: acyl-CoA dehydrogenase family protein, partial [Alphaproteobacteria bacterium]
VKHKGLSYFILDMHQPGVEVHQLKQMNGHASFNQVFITDAVIEPEYQMGELGEGWKVATTTLMHERRGADSARRYDTGSDRPERIYEEERQEIATVMAPYTWYPQRTGRVDLLIEHARALGRYEDPAVRQEIAKTLALARSAQWTALRSRAAQQLGRPQGPEGSIGKLASSIVARQAAKAHTAIAGAEAMLTGEDGHMDGVVAEILVSTPAISIAGGTDEIQRNIISERILQMPKEQRTDTDRPFREVPRNQVG